MEDMGTHCTCCESSHGYVHGEECHVEGRRLLLRAGLSGALLLTGICLDRLSGWGDFSGVGPLLVYVLAYLPVGGPVVLHALREIRGGEWFSEFTLMVVATVGAFCIGEWPEAVAVMLFYAVGEYFQDRAVGKARGSIRALIDLRPATVSVVRDSRSCMVAPTAVRVGEEIELPAGGRVPLDGVLLGTDGADFDTSALTGESMPRTVRPGGEVLAGMLATNAAVRLRVTRVYAESALARVLAMVRDAAERKAPAELFIRRFARVYTPAVIALAAAMALLPPLFGGFLAGGSQWGEWIYRALVFLVVSCPCALVLSVPLAYFSGIGRASRRGILFKGGNYLDALAQVDTVVFDKTGTLTMGHYSVTAMQEFPACADGGGEERLPALSALQAAASAESLSTHPVARALVKEAGRRGIDVLRPESVTEIPGKGLEARVAGHRVVVGNGRLLAVPEDMAGHAVYCVVDGELQGFFDFADELRPGTEEAVGELRDMGIRMAVLSGDRPETVAHVADALGLSDRRGGLLPDEKVADIRRRLQEPACRLAFVGDGINDAPALALSHVGIAMGAGGSDAAVEMADVVVQDGDLGRVAEAVRMARAVRWLVRVNIGLAIGVKVVVLLAGALGHVPLWLAILADTGVALLCVLNVFVFRK